jgi:hypothetical protein
MFACDIVTQYGSALGRFRGSAHGAIGIAVESLLGDVPKAAECLAVAGDRDQERLAFEGDESGVRNGGDGRGAYGVVQQRDLPAI